MTRRYVSTSKRYRTTINLVGRENKPPRPAPARDVALWQAAAPSAEYKYDVDVGNRRTDN